ncbi:phosphatidate cytidylyltransferase [Hyphomonas neptunium ATCC 15444]|uniref:Phosphatidate cytidylyltransferase n=2 Tax=Hyphomonas TaxID=85 RepID=Q0C1B6_HYPNA|nr:MULTISPECIES: phosphatidate cytidylyltransferase [Hyphomonas]ABI77210.1 phosphatidate cytidylyltransferase [Hyphomonas neptunium ATCC 15444]KCZ95110.1 phosphatidate cytidylyltransferase [Hyphomonas hirschiana VP5]
MGDWTPTERRFSELPVRLVSAFILIPMALAAVWLGGWWLATACAVFAFVMMLEWCAMSATSNQYLLAGLGGLFAMSFPLQLTEMTVAIAVAAYCLASFGARAGIRSRVSAGFGVIYVFAMVGGLYMLREGAWEGQSAALYFMSFVWASDAAAYFFGRAFGGPKLLPKESPNKTWSGAIAAVLACAICGYFASMIEGVDHFAWMACGIAISIVAQAGDLFESGLKRRFKVKDSGRILPGHGGLLDRVDGLGAVAVVGSIALAVHPGLATALGL